MLHKRFQTGAGFTPYQNDGTGFTLIELLVSIAILAILAATVMVVLDPVSFFKRARDSKRKGDLQLIQTALELYYQDNGTYPVCGWDNIDGSADCLSAALLGGGYIKTVPTDPISDGKRTGPCATGQRYEYVYYGTSTDFYLAAFLEAESVSITNCGDYDYKITCPDSWPGCGSGNACDCYGVQNQF